MQAIIATHSPTGVPIAQLSTVPLPPPLAPGELLIRVKAIALNLVDARYAYVPIATEDRRVIGSDFAGEVVEVGEGVEGWKVGDRAGAFLHGACTPNTLPGAFSTYTITPASTTFHLPSSTSYSEAATLPVCSVTAAQGLFERLHLPSPFPFPSSPSPLLSGPTTLLIYGASTTLGLFILQLARLSPLSSSLRIIALAGPKNHALVREMGADEVFDYRSSTWVESVREAAGKGGSGSVDVAFDCISEGNTVRDCSKCFDVVKGGKLAVVEKGWEREGLQVGVEVKPGLCWTALGKRIEYTHRPPLEEDPVSRAFCTSFYNYISPPNATTLTIKPSKTRIMPGGLERVVKDGFRLLGVNLIGERKEEEKKSGEEWMRPISAEKLVYLID